MSRNLTEEHISVIIPTFNRRGLLKRALSSVLHQTAPPGEIIVVDDGSTDGSSGMVRREFPAVIYLYQENRGVSAARNRGIAAARGQWLAFLDSDDEWLPAKLEAQIAALNTVEPEGQRFWICHTNEVWIRRGRRVNQRKKHRKFGGYIFQKCLPLCVISPSSVLIHRQIFETVGEFDETLPACEDYDLWLRICARYPVLFLDTPLIRKYGGHPDQLSAKHWGLDRFRVMALEKILSETPSPLTPEDQRAARETLLYKLDVLIAGAKKRPASPFLEEWMQKRQFYSQRPGPSPPPQKNGPPD